MRNVRPGDADLLREIHRRASYIWPEDASSLDANPGIFGIDPEALDAGNVRVALDAEGTPVGFASWRAAGEEAELIDLFVEPGAMRHGIGGALVEDAARRARRAGHARLTVVAHARTLRFYSRAGFVEEGPATTDFGPALRLSRDL